MLQGTATKKSDALPICNTQAPTVLDTKAFAAILAHIGRKGNQS